MVSMDVIDAFLRREEAEGRLLKTDGERLLASDQLIAEWFSTGFRVVTENQGKEREQAKDMLVHAVLARMAQQQLRPVQSASRRKNQRLSMLHR